MPKLTCEISYALKEALKKQSTSTGDSIDHLVSTALSSFFEVPLHTLFQVSTSGALVQGIYQRAVSSKVLLDYGDFGLGTFVDLDGEMVVLDGVVYQVRSDGRVARITGDVGTPFAVVVHFHADREEVVESAPSYEALTKTCDRYRESNNLFYAFRIDGCFTHIHTRAMKAAPDGLPLAKAAATQPEFDFQDVEGTLVGMWAPQFSSALNVAGYHFHFLSHDRTQGGHLLACSGNNLRIKIQTLNDFHLSLPESEEYLKADLSRDPSKDLAYAEQIHKKEDV